MKDTNETTRRLKLNNKSHEKENTIPNPKCQKCSWWYHLRCLKGKQDNDNCTDFDTSIHNCLTCSNFDGQPGSNKSGDLWYGLCYAYGVTPIRHNPAKHTCKAWS